MSLCRGGAGTHLLRCVTLLLNSADTQLFRTSLYDDLEKVAKSELDVGMPEDRLPDPDSKTPYVTQ